MSLVRKQELTKTYATDLNDQPELQIGALYFSPEAVRVVYSLDLLCVIYLHKKKI